MLPKRVSKFLNNLLCNISIHHAFLKLEIFFKNTILAKMKTNFYLFYEKIPSLFTSSQIVQFKILAIKLRTRSFRFVNSKNVVHFKNKFTGIIIFSVTISSLDSSSFNVSFFGLGSEVRFKLFNVVRFSFMIYRLYHFQNDNLLIFRMV